MTLRDRYGPAKPTDAEEPMGVSIDQIPSGSRTTDTRPPEEEGNQPPPPRASGSQRAPSGPYGTQPPLAPASEYGMQPPPESDVRLKRKVRPLGSAYGTQPPPAPSDRRLKRDLRGL